MRQSESGSSMTSDLIEFSRAQNPTSTVSPDAVKSFLLDNPNWLRDNPHLMSNLGLRLDAANLVDFGPVALSRVSAARQRESDERKRLEAMAQANFAAQNQTHAAVLDVLEASSLADLPLRVDELARRRFGLAKGVIAVENCHAPSGWIPLAEGQTDMLIGYVHMARLGRLPIAAGLFGSQATVIQSVALARLSLWGDHCDGVLAFGAFDEDAFTPDMGDELVTFLARVVERASQRWPRP